MSAGLDLPGSAQGFVTYRSWGKGFGFFAEVPCIFGKAIFQGKSLFKTADLPGVGLGRCGSSGM
ncbi:hypothetical protein XH89_20170 [Bradyrhizobium sp. CCBAU 53340]|nr:hypothetical protein XH89_20170 [Bradyrhizobium sp. CCBAU 53340]